MRTVDEYTLGAFLTALAQLDHPLDAETQATLNQISQTLTENETEAVKQLFQIAQDYPPLQAPYQTAYAQIQSNHQAQERQKFIPFRENSGDGSDVAVADEPEALQLLNTSQQILSANESVGIAQQVQRLTKAYEHALLIFRNPKNVWNWLNRPNGALGGEIPVELMGSDTDAHKVHTILGRIEHGVFS